MAFYPTRGIVLAAGLGVRMRPLTDDRPKPLLEIAGRTLLDHAIDRFKDAGVKTVIVNVHYRGEMVIAHLKKRADIEIRIQDERDRLLDTGGALRKALPHFMGEPFFTYNSDSIWVESLASNLTRMAQRWAETEMDCLMLMAPTFNSIGFEGRGDFTMDTLGRLTRRQPQRVAPFAWPGVQIIHPRLVERETRDVFSTNVLWDIAANDGRLYGIRLDGKWMHIGTPAAKIEAEAFLEARNRAA